MLTHSNFVSVSTAASNTGIDLKPTDIHFSYLPLAHIFERTIQVALFATGSGVIFSSGDPKLFASELRVAKPTFLVAVPRVLGKLHDGIQAQISSAGPSAAAGFAGALSAKLASIAATNDVKHSTLDPAAFAKVKEGLGLSNARFLLSGGAAISPSLKNFFRAVLSVPVLEGYGQTECTAAMTMTFMTDNNTSGHVGGPLPCVRVRLEDVPDMKYLKGDKEHLGEAVLGRGEVCIKGSGVFSGYYKMPGLTVDAIDEEGWLHTGDIGAWTTSGSLMIVDRKKDLFKLSQGEYVSPERVENALATRNIIAQAFVWGVGTKDYPVAVIVPDPSVVVSLGLKTVDEIKAAVMKEVAEAAIAQGLAGFEIVKDVVISPVPFLVENEQLTPTMKLRRVNILAVHKEALIKLYESSPVSTLKGGVGLSNSWLLHFKEQSVDVAVGGEGFTVSDLRKSLADGRLRGVVDAERISFSRLSRKDGKDVEEEFDLDKVSAMSELRQSYEEGGLRLVVRNEKEEVVDVGHVMKLLEGADVAIKKYKDRVVMDLGEEVDIGNEIEKVQNTHGEG